MKNRLSEEAEQELHDSVEEKASASEGFVRSLLSKGRISSLWAASHLPFAFFIFCLGVIYIANRHHTENLIRDINRVSGEVKVLSWEYKTLQSELMQKSTQSQIVDKVAPFGLEVILEPPRRILVSAKKK